MCICKGLKETKKQKVLKFSITFWELCMELLDLQGILLLPAGLTGRQEPGTAGTSWINQSTFLLLDVPGFIFPLFSLRPTAGKGE